jgi:predicted nucleic acid-binding protein
MKYAAMCRRGCGTVSFFEKVCINDVSSLEIINHALRQANAIIAATAWQLDLSLLTRNQKDFGMIIEIELAPVYRE